MNKSDNENSNHIMVGVNQFREALYLFLSRAFSREADAAFMDDALKILKAFEDLPDLVDISNEKDIQRGQQFLKGFFEKIEQKAPEQVLVDLSKEYAVSFLGIGGKTAALCESVYRGQTGSLFQEAYFEVKERYREIGMEKSDDFAEPDDHLSLELAYMAMLCRLIIESGENGGTQLHYLRIQMEFMQKHLMYWVPAFLKRLKHVSGSTFYEAWGFILNGYLKLDINLMDSLIQELETEK